MAESYKATGGIIGTGTGRTTNWRWEGHLVGLVAERHLVDLSIDQVNRPGLTIAPLVASAHNYQEALFAGFLDGRNGLPVRSGGAAMYYVREEDGALLEGWTRHLLRANLLVRFIGAELFGIPITEDEQVEEAEARRLSTPPE